MWLLHSGIQNRRQNPSCIVDTDIHALAAYELLTGALAESVLRAHERDDGWWRRLVTRSSLAGPRKMKSCKAERSSGRMGAKASWWEMKLAGPVVRVGN